MIVENVVAQLLYSKGDRLYFYTKIDKKSRKTELEIDFVIRRKNKIIPIEVKIGEKFTISSLLKYKKLFNNKIGLQ